MEEFLLQYKRDFQDRGTNYMVAVVEEMLEMNLSFEDLKEMAVECKAERDRHTQFNVKFMYYWGVQTYLEDMVRQYEKREVK